MNDVILQLKDNYHRLSKGQKAAADFILANPSLAFRLSASKTAEEANVSESTVIRLAKLLGYEGYPKFCEALAESFLAGEGGSEKKNSEGKTSETGNDILRSVMEADAKRIMDTVRSVSYQNFERAQELLLSAENVYILGMRTCEPLAEMLAFYLNMIRGNVHVLKSTSSSEVFEQMIRISSKDVMVGISFPRYSMRTLKAMEFAHDRNASVIAITDSDLSPMRLYSSCILTAKSNMVSVCDSLVAPLSLMNALIVALCVKKPKEVRNNLKTLESVWGDYQVYLNDEINFYNEETIRENTPVYHPDTPEA